MHTISAFLDDLKSLKNNASDYRIAKILEVSNSTVAFWRQGRQLPNSATCERLAKELGLPTEYVLACVNAEKEKSDSLRAVWVRMATAFSSAAAMFVAVILVRFV